jgi:hypothetical protein
MNLKGVYFHINSPATYFFYAIIWTIIFRIIISGLKVIEYNYNVENRRFNNIFWLKRFWLIFVGFSGNDPFPDFWYNSILGGIEISVFPILIKTGQYAMVGAWIGFKSVAQWNAWNKNRYVFNRFLIIHALILILCFTWLSNSIEIDPHPRPQKAIVPVRYFNADTTKGINYNISDSTDNHAAYQLYKLLRESNMYEKAFPDFERQYDNHSAIDGLYQELHKSQLYTKTKEAFYHQFFGKIAF